MIYRLLRLYGLFLMTFLVFIYLNFNSTYIHDEEIGIVKETPELSVNIKSALNDHKNTHNASSRDLQKGAEETKLDPSVVGPSIYILWTTWRSGSSFLGQLLAYAKKNTFYSYEPLHSFGLHIMREDDLKTKVALKFLFNSMNCRYDRYEFLVNYFVETEFYYFYNPLTKKSCQPIVNCNGSKILNELCEGASSQVIKLLRLSLKYGEYILKKNPQIKIIYLARDPRAVLQSRSLLPWCQLADCNDQSSVCNLLQYDVDQAITLQRLYPERFTFVRYEDLALNAEGTFRSIWEKLNQKYTKRIKRLIQAHVSEGGTKGIYGLQKNSKTRSFSWRTSLSYSKLMSIQNSCRKVMKNLGYAEYSSVESYMNLTQLPLEISWNSTLNEFSAYR